MEFFKAKILPCLLLLFFLGMADRSIAQYQQEEFGKNRIQYKKFKWQYLKTPFFDLYFYTGGTQMAYRAARHAEKEMKRISEQIGYIPYSKVKIFLYNSHNDLLQSNMGLAEQGISPLGGQTNFFKLKMEVAFKGDNLEFEKELSTAVARTLITDMVFNGSLREVLQSSFYQTLPDWYIRGLSAYLGRGWTVEMDDYMRDAVQNYRLTNPSKFSGDEAELLGQSIWNFIAEKYGMAAIPNILNLTRIVKNEEYGVEANIGIGFSAFLKEWKAYYTDINRVVTDNYISPDKSLRVRKINRKNHHYSTTRIDPKGRFFLYSESREGRYRVYLQDITSGKKRLLTSGGRRIIYQEQNYILPLVAWRNESVFSVIGPRKGKFVMKTYEIKYKETKKIVKEDGKARFETTKQPVRVSYVGKLPFQAFDYINAVDYSDDGKNIVFSADKEGQSDIFLYEIARGGAYRQITNDKFDDLYPRFIKNSNAFVFSSNRTNDTLGENDQERLSYLNLYTYDPARPRYVHKVRTSPHNEIQPLSASGQEIYFLSDENGIYNIFKYDTAAKTTEQVTRFGNSLSDYDYSPSTGKLSFVFSHRSKEFLYVDPSFLPDTIGMAPKTFRQEANEARNRARYEVKVQEQVTEKSTTKIDTSESDEIDINNYVFESEKKPGGGKKGFLVNGRKPRKSEQRINLFGDQFNITGPNPKIDFLRTNYITTSPFYFDNLLGWMPSFHAGAVDLMGNNRFSGGISLRVADIIRSPSYRLFGEYSFLGFRADLKLRYDRTQFFYINFPVGQKSSLDKIEGIISYPLSHTTRVSIAPFYAISNQTSIYNLTDPDKTSTYSGYRAEFVLDNTLNQGPNQLKGTRGKLLWENYYSMENAEQNFGRIQGDIRHYEPIHNELTLATRLVAGSFLGPNTQQYVLGGMDNSVISGVDTKNTDSPFGGADTDRDRRNFLFVQFATNMRGFDHDALSGKSHFLFNAELRWPIIRYFYKGTISSAFLKNLMLVGFYDAGSAWTGNLPFYIPYLNPDGRSNTYNTTQPIPPGSSFQASVINYKNPILQGFGLGVRTFLLGYYVKADFAWGVRDYNINPLRFYLSLGYDF